MFKIIFNRINTLAFKNIYIETMSAKLAAAEEYSNYISAAG